MTGGNLTSRKPTLILLSGLPGTGKTTFARALSERLAFEHVESDEIRRGLAPLPTYTSGESAARSEASRTGASGLGAGP